MFEGTYTALITPFTKNGIDIPALEKLIEKQIENQVAGIIPAGTTGESPTLGVEEHCELIRLVVQFAKGRIPVIAGSGANYTKEAILLTQAAEKAGASASLQVAPYYNKPSQEGIYQHFKAIAKETSLPLILYSIPGRCGVEIGIETCQRLSEEENSILGIKEAGACAERINQLSSALPQTCAILSGDDNLAIPFMSLGAKGLISVASNLIPKVMNDIVSKCLKNDYQKAREIHMQHYPLLKTLMSLETNPIPIKTALSFTKECQAIFRLPLSPLSAEKQETLKSILCKYELIK